MYDHTPEIPLPSERPILPLERLGALLEVVLCSGFPSQLLIVVVLRSLGMPLKMADGHLSPPFIFTLALADAAVVIGLSISLLKAHHESPRQVLFGDRSILGESLHGIALVPVVFILVSIVLLLVFIVAPGLHNVPNNPLEDMLRNRRDALIFAGVVMIAGGIREEVQRGFILRRFEQYLGGGLWGVAIYSVAFGLGHVEQGLDAMLATTLLGVFWGRMYLSRRSIAAPMACHAGFNLTELVKYLAFVKLTQAV